MNKISLEQLAYNKLAQKVGQLQAELTLVEAQRDFYRQELDLYKPKEEGDSDGNGKQDK